MTKAKQITLVIAIVISCILSGCQASAHSRAEEQNVPEHIQSLKMLDQELNST